MRGVRILNCLNILLLIFRLSWIAMMYYDSNPTPIYNDVLCANVVTTVNMLKILDNKKAANSCLGLMEKIKLCGIGSHRATKSG